MDSRADAERFREHGHRIVDWIADYLARVESMPVASTSTPGSIRALLPASPPESPEALDEIAADLDLILMPGITHWQSPRFFGYFPSSASPWSVLGDFVSSGLCVQGMLWATSPACTELETHMLDWLAQMLGLPARFRGDCGMIQDTASSATLCALLAARCRVSDGADAREGLKAMDRQLVAYSGAESHSHVEKDVRIAGLGHAGWRVVPVRADGSMDPQALAAQVRADREAGLLPFFCCATLGTTSTHAFDPLGPIAEVCSREGIWLHVDAAHAGVAAICPEFRWMHEGLERADSYCTNPHKWLGAHFDCSAFWVAEPKWLVRALSILPEYLRNAPTESGRVIDYRDWQVPLGRRFRALKLWFLIRGEGVEGLRARLRRDVALAARFRGLVESDGRFEIPRPSPLTLVTFRLRVGDDATRSLHEALLSRNRIFLTHTKVDGRYTLRMAIGQRTTEERHIDEAWEEIRAALSACGR